MKRYEYIVVIFSDETPGEMQDNLNSFGNNCWELIQVVREYLYILKREIEEDDLQKTP